MTDVRYNGENGKTTIKSFMDLRVWKAGHELVLVVYKITSGFPKEEIFGLVSQMRRCVVSITSNIAEGFARNSGREKAQFYFTSLGSITELQNQLLISKDLGYLTEGDFEKISLLIVDVHKMLNGLIRSSKDSFRYT